jgi:hypothetical protein
VLLSRSFPVEPSLLLVPPLASSLLLPLERSQTGVASRLSMLEALVAPIAPSASWRGVA